MAIFHPLFVFFNFRNRAMQLKETINWMKNN
jgi:hypothetical protein